MEKVIEIHGLTKNYGSFSAVNNLNLSVLKGEIFGLLGPNGAGKSTTILMMMGLTEPTDGQIKVCGIDPVRYPIEVKKKVGYLPEDVGFYEDLTGLENLVYTARLNGLSGKEAESKANEIIERVGLGTEKEKKAGKYSRGMRQRLGLGDVLVKNPEVIILDEPTLGIDPKGVKEFIDLIMNLSREEKLTVLLSSHHLHQVQQICDRVGIFVKGNLLAEGNIESLAKKIFSANTFATEAEIIEHEGKALNGSTDSAIFNSLIEKLKQIENVAAVTLNKNMIHVDSRENVSALIAKTIVESGFGLGSLRKKEYGLDDIYYRYFEGGKDYE